MTKEYSAQNLPLSHYYDLVLWYLVMGSTDILLLLHKVFNPAVPRDGIHGYEKCPAQNLSLPQLSRPSPPPRI